MKERREGGEEGRRDEGDKRGMSEGREVRGEDGEWKARREEDKEGGRRGGRKEEKLINRREGGGGRRVGGRTI